MKRLRVFQVTHDLNIGGLQRVVVDLAKHLDPERYEVSVCALREGGPLEDELRQAGIRVCRLPAPPDRVDYLLFWKLARLLREAAPDVVHTHNTQPLLDGGAAALLARVPVRVHTDHAREYPDRKRYMLAERVMSRFVDRIAAVSEHTRRDLVRWEGIRPEKIVVVPNGIQAHRRLTAEEWARKRRELDLPEGGGPVLGIGVRLTPQKGIGYLLQALPAVIAEFPGVTLLIAGDGELAAILRREAAALGIGRHVSFLGPRLDMPEVLQVLDLYVLPSLWEGMPLVLLEAMSASLAVVATDVGGTCEVVSDGVNGLLVPPRDPAALGDAIRTLLRDQRRRREFGAASREIFGRRFTVRAMVASYEELYRQAGARGR